MPVVIRFMQLDLFEPVDRYGVPFEVREVTRQVMQALWVWHYYQQRQTEGW
jgi:hypothetical protein